MATIKVYDKVFEKTIDAVTIGQVVGRIASAINLDYEGKNPLFIAVLNGSFVFAADLIRKVTIPCQISFVKLSSYTGTRSAHKVKELIGLNEDLNGRHVVIIEDIVESGTTLDKLLEDLKTSNPGSVRVACLTFKKDAFIKDFQIDYVGIIIPDEFVLGYGLDYEGYGRNLPDIYKIMDKK